ncbi:uncharacterized protein TRIVIDRAFT_46819 [Trichoderma virens Gv29-8]|uniref:Epoxide hydrolase N-terminal domain-containing protein n=1 Tax=Hypocrea virens (strain Gv29-8 / FGSC 10586) TaxID=413071 RepID=G9N0R4_HYPVG|nr:uncharacterized protein TRIVIDRAFT_46819 [Trichoderma virens Gv29-8]EHK19946.1 hypothetical protein TRIVIDRAFT_46819 [Trichoderma virens Gv29-8]UKZ53323.1 hypothetical protein TrVGV298_007115 [Trichoderma virens]
MVLPTSLAASIANINAAYGVSPAPFSLKVSPRFELETRQKLAMTRFTDDIGLPLAADGPTTHNQTTVRDYWLYGYKWKKAQEKINSFFTQYTTTVQTRDSNYTDPIPLHFVHHRSPRRDAIPLLFIHGYPGSFLEVGPIINSLTHPPNSSVPAFHVVAPSIPGYGFSPAPVKPGFGPREAGRAFNALMHQLNYTQYVIQGGDLGGIILRYQANSYPESVVSVLDNFWTQEPTADDWARFNQKQTTAEETAYLNGVKGFQTYASGYVAIQSTRPLQLAIALTDSPIGFAMWIYDFMAAHGVHPWSLEEIVTWSMMYLIQGPYNGLRFYKEFQIEGAIDGPGFGTFPYVPVPVGVTQRTQDLGWSLPLDWAKRGGNVTALYRHELVGGHFPAYQTPDSLAEDIWDFFGNHSISGTGIFKGKVF